MAIGEKEVRKVATLARLRLDDAEVQALAADLGRILDYVDKLASLDTSGVEPTSHVVAAAAPMRDDVLAPRDAAQAAADAVANAPRREGTFFAVPPIIE